MLQRSECLQLITEEPQTPQAAPTPKGYVPGGVQIETDQEIEDMTERYRRLLEPVTRVNKDGTTTIETYTAHAC